MDIADLERSIAHGGSIESASEFTCRAGGVDKVERTARESGLPICRDARCSAPCLQRVWTTPSLQPSPRAGGPGWHHGSKMAILLALPYFDGVAVRQGF